jgi:hypothetical protein
MATSYESKKKTSGAASSKKRAAAPRSGSMIPYGDPIRDAMARGDLQEMRRVAASARKWVSEVTTAMTALEYALAQQPGRTGSKGGR